MINDQPEIEVLPEVADDGEADSARFEAEMMDPPVEISPQHFRRRF